MRHISSQVRYAAVVCGSLWLTVGAGYGQTETKSAGYGQGETKPAEPQVLAIRKIEGIGPRYRIYTPEYQTSVPVDKAQIRMWGQISVTYDTAPDWMDELNFQFFVLLKKEEKGKAEYSLFRGSVSCIDVQRGQRHQTMMLLRPTALTRYGEVVGADVEISYKGEVVGVKSEESTQEIKSEKEWWKNPKLSVRDGYLLNRLQTPFAFVNYDEYELIKQ